MVLKINLTSLTTLDLAVEISERGRALSIAFDSGIVVLSQQPTNWTLD